MEPVENVRCLKAHGHRYSTLSTRVLFRLRSLRRNE